MQGHAPNTAVPPGYDTLGRSKWPMAVGLLVALAFMAQPLWHLTSTGSTDDWRWFTFHWEVSWHTITQFHRLPVWNPYHCGGNVHLANPQTQFLSPLAWPAAIIGVPLGIKLFMLMHLVLGYLGMWWLARDAGGRPWPATLAASLFVGGGFFFQHVGGGHSSFLPFLLAPAALAAFRRSVDDPRYVAATAGILALMVLEGGVYPAPYTGLLLTIQAAAMLARDPRDLRPLYGLAAAGLLAGAMAGVKLLPVMAFLREHPRLVKSDDGMGLTEVLAAFVSRRLERRFPGHPYVWPEYGAYLGWPVVLAVLWLAWAKAKRYKAWLWTMVLFALLMTGNRGGGLSPHEILHELPIFESLHVPSRFGSMVTLLLALLAGFAVQELWARLMGAKVAPRTRKVLAGLLILGSVGAVVDTLTFGQWQMGRFKDGPVRGLRHETFTMTRAPWREARSFPSRNIGTLQCYEPNGVPRGKVIAGSPPVFLAGGARGRVQVTGWAPDRVTARIRATSGGLVVLDQNEHRGWRVEGAGERTTHRGMPAARIQGPDELDVTFSYHPPGLVPGLILTLLGVVAAWLTWSRLTQARLRAFTERLAASLGLRA